MTQLSRILSLTFFVAVLLVLPSPAAAQGAAAQNNVTPVVKPTPPGQLIVVNNGPGNHTDPHVDGDLVSYTDQQSASSVTIRYFNLATHTDNAVPSAGLGTLDFLSDVRGTTIVFTRSGAQASILTFDTASSTLTILDPTPDSLRFGGQIGDQTIAWQDFCPATSCSTTTSSMVAWDRASNTATVISGPSPTVNQNPGISPDGSTVVWEDCTTPPSCTIWKAVRLSAGTWNSQQLVSQFAGGSHPDTDGTIIAYAGISSTYQIAWQPVAGGTEQVLNLPGSAINPSVSGGLVVFNYDPTGSGVHQFALYDTRSNFLYHLSADANPGDTNDTELNDVSVTPDGKVRVVWQERDANAGQWNVYAYTFNLPESVPFSKFRVRVEAELTRHHDRDRFEAEGEFELGKGSPGINPAQDSLHFSAMGGSTNIVFDVPLSSFHAGHHGRLSFHGMLNGFPVEIELRPLHHSGFYEFTLEAHKMNLAHFSNPADVTLQVGKNFGTALVHADIDNEESERGGPREQ